MAYLDVSTIFLFLLPLMFHAECRITQETLAKTFATQGTKWAVLLAGSMGYDNYRHQADVCHAYQILKKGGLKDENIVVFMYDDIALDINNPKKGTIINKPDGSDVYKGVPKDYTGKAVTTGNFLAAILGNKTATKGGSGKVVNSGPNDTIFIYYSDHGSPGVLTMPTQGDLYAKDFINTLKKKHDSGTYKSMVIYVEACGAGSIFEGLLPMKWNIYVTTASNLTESSWATYCPGFHLDDDNNNPTLSQYDTCLGDLYSVAWMEDSDAHNLQSETLDQQFRVVRTRTAPRVEQEQQGSHVMQYGNTIIGKDKLSLYMGASPNSTHKAHPPKGNGSSKGSEGRSKSFITVKQHDADILYLQQKVRKAPEGSTKREEAQKKLVEALSHRKHVDSSIQAIGEALFGANQGLDLLKIVRSSGQPIVDDWDCFKTLVGTYEEYCGRLSTYGKRHLRAFANMCNAGIHQSKLAQASSLVCAT